MPAETQATQVSSTPYFSLHVVLCCALWLVAAVAAGASGVLKGLRPPAPQVLLLGLTALLLVALRTAPRLRAWAMTVDLRWLVALHLSRLVGFYFLLLSGSGELPAAFAIPGGWGDNAVALLAIVVLVTGRSATKPGWIIYLLWNVLGLIDILLVVATAARIGLSDPQAMRALLVLPLSLLITFLVPLIIATHVLIFVKLATGRIGKP